MLVASIDVQNGHAVQLRQGKTLIIDAGDPRPIAERFAALGEIAVIDLDAAMGTGSNAETIKDLLKIARCRVGGGIRDVDTARMWLNEGAHKIILGTAAKPELLAQLPRARTIAALDARDGEIVTHGWTTRTGQSVPEQMRVLGPLVGGFLVTFIETEGTLSGFDVAKARPLIELARELKCELTVAGGVTTAKEVGELDTAGADAQVGMSLYKGLLHPADAIFACLSSDRADGLVPTVVVDEAGVALGLTYSSQESFRCAVDERRGIYQSRTRGLWRKGENSGNIQKLLRVDLDCDRDTLRLTVEQMGSGFCHKNTMTCFGEATGLAGLEQRIRLAKNLGDAGSYTQRLMSEAGLLEAKIVEEARELCEAKELRDVAHEAADVIFFTAVRLMKDGLSLHDVARELDKRALKVSRRKGDAKPE